jgi:hypothetical protein
MLGLRERLPDLGRRVGEVADENERPLLSILSDIRAGRGTLGQLGAWLAR